jgi:branched-chain amino acid transport system permease protein
MGSISVQALYPQLLLGLINGASYALLSLGLSIIFGMLNVINFAHGSLYMLGAFVTWGLLHYAGIPYWGALVIAPLVVGAVGANFERRLLRRLYRLDPLYNLLLTFGIALYLQGMFQLKFGSSGEPYQAPDALQGARDVGFMILPYYRAWVMVVALVVCLATWYVTERTRLGSYLRAATENPGLVQAFGINVPRMITVTYGLGVALAGFAGVLDAPRFSVSPEMGSELIIVVFAVVVIGGMGSIMGSIVTGFALGLIEGLTKVLYPPASNTVVFALMALVLLIRPAGLFGKAS